MRLGTLRRRGSGRGSGDALRRTGSLRRALMYICMQNPRPPPMSVVVAGISTADVDTAAARCVPRGSLEEEGVSWQ